MSYTSVAKFTRSGEILAILVERACHDAIGRVKRFFDTIAVVDIDVDIEDSLFEAQQLQDAQNDI